MRINQRFLIYFFWASLLLNVVAMLMLVKNSSEVKFSKDFSAAEQRYPLLSKRILQEFPQDILINFIDLRNSLHRQIDPYGSSFSVYFEYLPTGTSIGVNGADEFHAASLFKLPVVMAYYRAVERDPSIKDLVVEVKPNMIDKEFGSLWRRGAGAKIKLSEAARLAIVDSDNTAAKVLVAYISKEDFESAYQGLDIDLHSDKEGAILTAKNYSSILKALYFSSVLKKDNSEELLDTITKTKFFDKLPAGVPNKIPVAHKIGDFNDVKGNEAFTDCGIVYVPKRPYSLCMLSKGDEQTARERMQAVSKLVYDFVSSRD